jgi:hypothetical protein
MLFRGDNELRLVAEPGLELLDLRIQPDGPARP